MKDKIEVGEYVRVNNDNRNCIGIGKAIRLVNESVYVNMNNKYNLSVCFQINNIVKHSKQLIDLIEVGDIIKYRIDNISTTLETKGYIKGIVDIADEEMLQRIKSDKNYNILEILTREQYMANCYKVGGEDNWDTKKYIESEIEQDMIRESKILNKRIRELIK